MTIQARIEELSKESQELNRRLENLEFFKEQGYIPLLDIADELENKHAALFDMIQAVIADQLEQKPKEMDDKEREIWYTSTLSRLIRINNMIGSLISEIAKMRKAM